MKKQYIALLLCALLLTGCARNTIPAAKQSQPSTQALQTNQSAQPPEQTQPTPQPTQFQQDDVEVDISQHLLGTPVDFKAQYVRTDGFYYYADTGYPHVVVIDSKEAGREYHLNMVPHDFGDGEPTISTGALKPLVGEEYTEDFFVSNYLVYVILEEPSGSISHTVESVRESQDERLKIAVKRNVPEVGTDDMAYWHIVLELPRNEVVADARNIDVFLDGVLAYNGERITPEVERPSYENPPKAKLHYPDGTVTLIKGSFSWKTVVDGQEQMIIADMPHPLQLKNLLQPITMSGEYVKVEIVDFPVTPESVKICCWQSTAWGQTDTLAEELSDDDLVFDVKPGGYIYQITVKFAEYGSVNYYAYIRNYLSDIS